MVFGLALAGLAFVGCESKRTETNYVANGQTISIAVNREDTTEITVKNSSSEVLLRTVVSRPGTFFTVVSITGPLNESLCRTKFERTAVDTKALPAIQFRRSIEDLPNGERNETRQWWCSNEFLVYGEELTYSGSGTLKNRVFKGPHSFVFK
jgi:hypothetical protein